MSAMAVLDMMSNDESPSVTLEYFRASSEEPYIDFEQAMKKKLSVTLARTSIEKAKNPCILQYPATDQRQAGRLYSLQRLQRRGSAKHEGCSD